MPYTFGAAVGDDITWSGATTIGAVSRGTIVTGWWRPTTLTAGRGYWSAANAGFSCRVDTTTSDLRLVTGGATTPGEWTAASAGVVVDEWHFIAVFANLGTTTLTAWRAWVGTPGTAPTELTITNAVAQVGNHTGSTAFYVGNRGTGNFAFQGDAANVTVLATSAGGGAASHPFGVATLGTTTNNEAQYVYERFVCPAWEGDYGRLLTTHHATLDTYHWTGDPLGSPTYGNSRSSAALAPIAATVSGATVSANGAPRPAIHPLHAPRRRR